MRDDISIDSRSSADVHRPEVEFVPLRLRTKPTRHRQTWWYWTAPILAVLSIVVLFFIMDRLVFVDSNSRGPCVLSFGVYRGHEYNNKRQTVAPPICLIESKWMKVQQHTVRLTETSSIISDWLWIDYHDRINVLVQESDDQFIVLKQATRYALEGKASLAVIERTVEPDGEPQGEALRLVSEKLMLDCKTMTSLGRFRSDVNRGMGWVHAILASKCSKIDVATNSSGSEGKDGDDKQTAGDAKFERQDLKRMTFDGLRQAVIDGKFLEVQWSNTVALALLYLSKS